MKKPRCDKCTRPVAARNALCGRCDPNTEVMGATASTGTPTLGATASSLGKISEATREEQERMKKPRCPLCTRPLPGKGEPCSRCEAAPM